MFSLETFRSRTGFAAAASLVVFGTASVLLVLLEQRTWRIVAAAAIWAVAAALLVWLAVRAHAQERTRQEKLAHTEARHRALLEGLPLVTWLTAPGNRGSTLYVSPAIEGLTGYSPTEWAERPELFGKLLHPEDAERVAAELEESRNGMPLRLDYRLLARDGRTLWVREESTTVRGADGEPLYVQTFLRDLGELRRAEDQREQLSAAEQAAAAEVSERQARLDLARRAGDALAATVDQQAALAHVADLVVRELADWCIVDVIEDGNELTRLAVSRAEPAGGNGRPGPRDVPGTGVRAVAYGGRSSSSPRRARTRVSPRSSSRASTRAR